MSDWVLNLLLSFFFLIVFFFKKKNKNEFSREKQLLAGKFEQIKQSLITMSIQLKERLKSSSSKLWAIDFLYWTDLRLLSIILSVIDKWLRRFGIVAEAAK